ncbi:MAG: sporulation protein YunB [Candidatus Howiella sp.]|jgi:sporulation protein YunB
MKKTTYLSPSKRRKRRSALVRLIAALLILGVALFALDRRLYPLIRDFAEAEAAIRANQIINAAVADYFAQNDVAYTDLIVLSRNAQGEIDTAEANTVQINQIKTSVIDRVRARVAEDERSTVSIPLGNLTGLSYLAGRGPVVRISLQMSSNVTASFESAFTSAGINQTMHTITLRVSADMYIMLPTGRASSSFSTDYMVGQTVIVGAVPDSFTSIDLNGGTILGRLVSGEESN